MPPKSNSRRKPSAKTDLSYIVEALRPLAVPIETLNPDPTNARLHDERNLQTIQSSIAMYGQRTPIVVNKNGSIIEKGNGTWQAMKAAGHSHIAVVMVEDDPKTQAGYSIADNRAGELASWDTELLESQLAELGDTDFDIESIGFAEGELDDIISSALPPDAETPTTSTTRKRDNSQTTPAGDESARLTDKCQVIVECSDEQQQTELLERFQTEGLTCRAIVA